jgi:hypothetical protein
VLTADLRPVAVVGGGYLATVLGGGLRAGGVRDGVPTAVALATMHLGWGIGFLVGPPRGDRPSSDPPGGVPTETDG